MKVADLFGAELDLWVAKAEGKENVEIRNGKCMIIVNSANRLFDYDYSPSTQWAAGGPIIEREKIRLTPLIGGGWYAEIAIDLGFYKGSTILEAAMRSYVANKFPEEFEEGA